MSRSKEDSFISSDDEDNECPLCMEEFDLSDRNFKPCPCGYHVCQFCWNNIRNNPSLNGNCPACRRKYSEQTVEFKPISAEEWKSDHQKQTRLKLERRQKERERKENESASRKHLSGMRVVQKNLVYVIGLNPKVPLDDLHTTLRGHDFFGQYGPVRKIVISKRGGGSNGIGVYVTFLKKEDAARCIAAVDGAINDGIVLKANYGTTKYCSAYLRIQTCQNPQCMYLHEPGEEQDSFTRQDLSTYNFRQEGLSKPVSSLGDQIQRSISQSNFCRSSENDSALPPTVSWANKNVASPSKHLQFVHRERTNDPPYVSSQSNASSKSIKQCTAEDTASHLFSNIITSLSNAVEFSLAPHITESQIFEEAQSLPPFFVFISFLTDSQRLEISNNIKPALTDGSKFLIKRDHSRYNFSDVTNTSHSHKQIPQINQDQSFVNLTSASEHPPGFKSRSSTSSILPENVTNFISSGIASRNAQAESAELLSHLMRGKHVNEDIPINDTGSSPPAVAAASTNVAPVMSTQGGYDFLRYGASGSSR